MILNTDVNHAIYSSKKERNRDIVIDVVFKNHTLPTVAKRYKLCSSTITRIVSGELKAARTKGRVRSAWSGPRGRYSLSNVRNDINEFRELLNGYWNGL